MLLLYMIFGHCIGDYVLQSNYMAQAKCKSFWYNNETNKYSNEWISILFAHSFIWSMCVHIPIILLKDINIYIKLTLFSSIILNTFMHMIIDHVKANKKAIDLNQDQLLHLIHIVITRIFFFGAYF